MDESNILEMTAVYCNAIKNKCEVYLWDRKVNLNKTIYAYKKKVQVGKDQEKAQSEKDSHSKNRGGKKPN